MQSPPSRKKIYVYVDETGLHPPRQLFVPVVIIIGEDREELRSVLKTIESTSRKGAKKWTKATSVQRYQYIQQVVRTRRFDGKLFFSRYSQSNNLQACIQETIAHAIALAMGNQPYEATILIDALGKTEIHRMAVALRYLEVKVRKVRGLDDQSDEFIRLADAFAGFIKDVLEEDNRIKELWETAARHGLVTEIKNPRG